MRRAERDHLGVLLQLYDSRNAFQRGLIHHGRFAPARAAELSGYAIGVALPRSLLLLASARATLPSFEWHRLIAHELSHVAQRELAGVAHRPPLWLEEGMAEWAAYRAVDSLAPGFFRDRHAAAWKDVGAFLRGSPAVDLPAVGAPGGFAALRHHVGPLLAYRLAFALTDTLVTRAGFDRVVGYFRLFRESDDAEHNFERAFAISPVGFARVAAAAGLGTDHAISSDAPRSGRPGSSCDIVMRRDGQHGGSGHPDARGLHLHGRVDADHRVALALH